MKLTAQQVTHFKVHGFVIVPDVVTANALSTVIRQTKSPIIITMA